MVNRVVFEIAYEGPAVDDGIMDVRELAPALLALGDLVERSNQVIGDPKTQTKVIVRSKFEKGSFQIVLELLYTVTEQIKLLFDIKNAINPAERLLAQLGFITGTGLSLMALIKLIKGRNIKNATVLQNGNVRLELVGDNGKFEYVEADKDVIRLYRDYSVRENLYRMLSPLKKEGITGFSARKGKQVVERVTKDEVGYYEVPDIVEEEQTVTSVRKAFVNLVEVAFEEGLKWRLSDGDNRFYATIKDEEFLRQINEGKSFTKGDVLEVELETVQVATPKGIRNEYHVLKVLRHLSQPQQIPLPFDKDNY